MGYTIEITKVEQTGEMVIVHDKVIAPGQGCFTPQTISQPFDIVDIRNMEARVTFTTETSIVNCS